MVRLPFELSPRSGISISFGEEIVQANVEFKLEGSKLSGNLNELKLGGTVEDDTLKFTGNAAERREVR